MEKNKGYYRSPIGWIEVEGTDMGICSVGFVEEEPSNCMERLHPEVENCIRQLEEYFTAERKEFSLMLDIQGTAFRKNVWEALLKIPYGKTASYRDVAIAVGNAKAVRAVGGANHNNPIGIVIPCHRVIGADGSLTGYGGGVWRKEWLLNHEKA